MDKKSLRAELRRLQDSFLVAGGAVSDSESIWRALEHKEAFAAAKTVLIYMDIPGEVPTGDFIRKWRGEKRFVIPLVSGDSLLLKEYDPDRLVEGYKGILEPSEDAVDVSPEELDLALVPGVAFSRMEDGRCLRMGRGKGFYDRLLPSLSCPSVGVGFGFRWLDVLPVDPWDVTLDDGVGD